MRKARVLLGVTGGIAAYKACELVRLLKKQGHEVRVLMSAHAEQFVGALTFESLSGNKVLRSLGADQGSDLSATAHIDLAQWGEIFVVAPATANFMAKYAHGIADDALLTEALAFTGPVLLAPAMNTRMWEASATQANLKLLRERSVAMVGPESGDLACGETGLGKMSEPAKIMEALGAVAEARTRHLPLHGVRVLVTSGPTRNYLDPVRFISNRSSGRMGHAIADAAERLGADVTLVTGPVDRRYAELEQGKVVKVESTTEMAAAVEQEFARADLVFATAAVSDFEAPAIETKKMARAGSLELSLKAAPDVIGNVAKNRNGKQVLVGFAAEVGEGPDEFAKARDKVRRKSLDLLAFNNVGRSDIGFDVDDNQILLFSKAEDDPESWPKLRKTEVADRLVRQAFGLWESRQ